MKKQYSGSKGGHYNSRFIPAFGIAGKLTRQTVTRPTLALMTENEARSFKVPGLKISHVFSTSSQRTFLRAVLRARSLSHSGKINIVVKDPFAIRSSNEELVLGLNLIPRIIKGVGFGNRRHAVRSDKPLCAAAAASASTFCCSSDIEVEVESDPDGTPVIVIITPTAIPLNYRVKHVVRDKKSETVKDNELYNNGGGEPPAPPKYLKVPNNDMLIISALQETDKKLLNESHVNKLRYRDSRGYNVKQFNDIHLLVCLFFYIYVNELNASSDFYFGLRGHFHEFCTKNVSKGINLGSKSYFTRCINRLENTGYSFEEYIKADKKPDIRMEKGDFNFVFWYEIYLKAERYFRQIIKPLPRT